jgi:hypothetical protein
MYMQVFVQQTKEGRVENGSRSGPNPCSSPIGLLDRNLYVHEHSITLPISTLKMEAACTFEMSSILLIHTIQSPKSSVNTNSKLALNPEMCS